MPGHCNERRSESGDELEKTSWASSIDSRSATEHRPAGDRCGRVQMNVDIVGSRRNGPQLSTRHDDDDDDAGGTLSRPLRKQRKKKVN